MLRDLDQLMRERGIDVAVAPMHEAMHPAFRWLSRAAKVTKGYAVKPLDADPVLVTYPMEREEAAATGLEVVLVHEFDHDRIFREAANAAAAFAELFAAMLARFTTGRTVTFLGNAPLHLYLGIGEEMASRGWIVHRPGGEDLVQQARKRKEPWEIEAIRSVGERTEQVVDQVRAVLRASVIRGDEVHFEGRRLTLGYLKSLVTDQITKLGMIEDHETILSQGRDAGVPHSRGNAAAAVLPSQPIVLDIFPADRTSGYFFDLTRTFCVGPVPDELRRIHGQVFEAFERARDAMRPGTPAQSYQALVCDYFESKGYATLRSNPKTTSGYVHGLGHGVGLEIHEKPSFQLVPSNKDLVEPGDILTIEPGLYFPERAVGVRIEDTFVVTETGVQTLARGSYGLEP